ncbi:hypothetical protein JW935_03390 [candidate division KSB1 bacterium]|nr:hypothetical protein [candidate division KSB1 bacterium]
MMSGLCACGGGVRLHGSYGRFDKNEVCFNELGSQSDQTAGGAGIIINEAPDSLVIESNAINNNLVKQGWGIGGGVLIGVNSSPVFVNNIIEANSSNDGGGLMIGGSSVVQFINNTVINNQATNTGGGSTIRNFSTVYLMNSIFWGNFASANAGINLEDATIKAAFCDIQGGWVGTGNINLDPQLDADGLLDSSPCIGS